MLRVLSIAHRFRYREIVLEVDLGRGDESGAHEDAEDGEADRVVLLPCVRAAGMLGEGGAVVQRDAHEEHGQAPAQAAEHSLVAVSARGERERERDAKRSGRKQDGTFYLSASSPSNVITAESARVMAGAEKNSPTITSSNSRKKVFWMSWTNGLIDCSNNYSRKKKEEKVDLDSYR